MSDETTPARPEDEVPAPAPEAQPPAGESPASATTGEPRAEAAPGQTPPAGPPSEGTASATAPAAQPPYVPPNASGSEGAGQPPEKRRTWIWVVVVLLVLVALGVAYAASSSSGGGLLLLFRGSATVPQVVGLPQADAQSAIVDAGLKVGQQSEIATLAVAPGTVVAQSPAASTKVEKGSSVDISVAAVPSTQVPDVTGKTLSDASAELAEQGLLVGTTSYVYDSKIKAGYVKSQQPEAGTQARIGSAVALTVSKGQQTGQVPNVIGLPEAEARSTLEASGFKVTTTKAANADVPAGNVVAQSPAAGTVVAAGSTVTVTVSSGPPPAAKPTVPNVIGLSESEAKSTLEGAGFKVSVTKAANADVPAGNVVSQSPAAGASANAGSTVTITVSTGPPPAAKPSVPNVVGLSEGDAISTLEGAGFKVSTTKAASSNVPAGDVISQSPTAGTTAAEGSTVNIKVSTGPPSAPKVTVPDVVGMRSLEAVRTLGKAGLKFKIVFTKTEGDFLRVASQDPKAGAQVDPGTTVEIAIGLPGFLLSGEGLPSPPEGGAPTVTPLPSEPGAGAAPTSSVTTP